MGPEGHRGGQLGAREIPWWWGKRLISGMDEGRASGIACRLDLGTERKKAKKASGYLTREVAVSRG